MLKTLKKSEKIVFCSCFLFFTKFINDLEQNLCQEWGKGQRYLLWKYRFLVMIFRCGMSVQLPALFWLVYDWLNQIWPMKLERADSCESSHMSFLENQKVVPGESERSPRVYFLDPRMTTHNCACALKGLSEILLCYIIYVKTCISFNFSSLTLTAFWSA